MSVRITHEPIVRRHLDPLQGDAEIHYGAMLLHRALVETTLPKVVRLATLVGGSGTPLFPTLKRHAEALLGDAGHLKWLAEYRHDVSKTTIDAPDFIRTHAKTGIRRAEPLITHVALSAGESFTPSVRGMVRDINAYDAFETERNFATLHAARHSGELFELLTDWFTNAWRTDLPDAWGKSSGEWVRAHPDRAPAPLREVIEKHTDEVESFLDYLHGNRHELVRQAPLKVRVERDGKTVTSIQVKVPDPDRNSLDQMLPLARELGRAAREALGNPPIYFALPAPKR